MRVDVEEGKKWKDSNYAEQHLFLSNCVQVSSLGWFLPGFSSSTDWNAYQKREWARKENGQATLRLWHPKVCFVS